MINIIDKYHLDLLKFSTHDKTNYYIETLFTQGYLPLITKPTRVTSHSATLIDHIYTNKIDCDITAGIVITDVADHFGVMCVIEHRKSTSHHDQHKNTRIYSDTNYQNSMTY